LAVLYTLLRYAPPHDAENHQPLKIVVNSLKINDFIKETNPPRVAEHSAALSLSMA